MPLASWIIRLPARCPTVSSLHGGQGFHHQREDLLQVKHAASGVEEQMVRCPP